MTTPRKRVTAFTDGACSGNPGPGGYGVILQYGDHRRELSGGFRRTTNNRMELMGPITALETLREPCIVTVVTDSEYVVNGIGKGWAKRWRGNGWRRPGGRFSPNWELWSRLLDLCDVHDVKLSWIAGHAGHVENERCDELARMAAAQPNLPADVGYENPPLPV